MEKSSPYWYQAESLEEFYKDVQKMDVLIKKLTKVHQFHYQHAPDKREITSWRNSLRAFEELLQKENLRGDISVILEAFMDLRTRVDVILCGQDQRGVPKALLVELKEWSPDRVKLEGCEQKDSVLFNKKEREHPCTKVLAEKAYIYQRYKKVLPDEIFEVSATVYMHNAHRLTDEWSSILYNDPLGRADLKNHIHIFTQEDEQFLLNEIKEELNHGSGIPAVKMLEKIIEPKTKEVKEFSMITNPENETKISAIVYESRYRKK